MAYGGTVVIQNPRRATFAKPNPKLPQVHTWIVPTDTQIEAAEDFLVESLWHGPMDWRLVRRERRKRRINRGALTAARKRLGIETDTTLRRLQGSKNAAVAWAWRLPDKPTVVGAKAILRYRQRQRSSQAQT